jgi:hypothetical protein
MKRLTLIGITLGLLLGFAIWSVKRGVKVKAAPAVANTTALSSFTISPLLLTNGSSEPEISIGHDGTMAMVSLSFCCGTELWTGPFGSIPADQGVVDAALQQTGRSVYSGHDADVDVGSTGRLHLTTLVLLAPSPLNSAPSSYQFGVSAITCPDPKSAAFSINQCTEQFIDRTNSDRPWITSDGPHVYISYRDDGNSTLIHVQRSDDDGFTWQRVGDPIVGQAETTADATFNNKQGEFIADPTTHNVYNIYAAGETGVLKARTFTPNHIIVSRSSDMGRTWTANIVFTAAPGTRLGYFFPALAVDPTTGSLYAAWSDGNTVFLASSTDQGSHWTSPVAVSSAPAATAIFPWVAAYNGIVDVVYYGTSAASPLDASADYYVYFAQLNGSGFTQTQVNSAPNHHGCVACSARSLLDLFQVAIDPQDGKAAIIYVDDTLTTFLPQAVLAQQN